ncbi:MAG: thiamine-phosphate kinase [Pseudorhodoplanes sp.]
MRGKKPPLSGEDRMIARYFAPLAKHPGALGLRDDAARFAPAPGHELVLTADAVIGGVHFLPDDPPDLIARKALRVNLSDLAAKGARPAGFLLSLALPRALGASWLARFSRGLGQDVKEFSCPLLGGDSVRTPGPLAIAITAIGTVPHGGMVRRRGARSGDAVMVSGTIGDAALGLQLCLGDKRARSWRLPKAAQNHLVGRYRLPRPRVALAQLIRRHASAAMDVSDGLAGDLAKLCRESGVSAAIDVAQVPLSAAARRVKDRALETILTGGDDYEILFTARPDRVSAFRKAGVPVTVIGTVVAGDAPPAFVLDGRRLIFGSPAFSHF